MVGLKKPKVGRRVPGAYDMSVGESLPLRSSSQAIDDDGVDFGARKAVGTFGYEEVGEARSVNAENYEFSPDLRFELSRQ